MSWKSFDELSSDEEQEKENGHKKKKVAAKKKKTNLKTPEEDALVVKKTQRTLSSLGFLKRKRDIGDSGDRKKKKQKIFAAKKTSDSKEKKKRKPRIAGFTDFAKKVDGGLTLLKKPQEAILGHNEKFCKILIQLSAFEKAKGDAMRANAYTKAVHAIRSHNQPIKTQKEAQSLFNVGKKIAKKIEEIENKGKLRKLDEYKNNEDLVCILELCKVHAIGPKTAKKLVENGYKTVDDLRNNPQILNAKQKLGVDYFDDIQQRIPRNEVTAIFEHVQKIAKKVDSRLTTECCGSYRRMKENSGDVDVIIGGKKSSFKNLVNKLKEDKFLVAELSRGATKFLGICKHPEYPKYRRIDLLYFAEGEYYSALIWYTGSASFNRQFNIHANTLNMQLNEKGLYHLKSELGAKKKIKGDLVVVSSERDVFKKLKVVYLNPKERDWGK